MVLLIADDHEIVRKGVSAILIKRGDLTLYEAANGQEAVDKALDLQPDLVILDVSMPILDGLSATRQIHAALPCVPILILSMHEGREIARASRNAGARGFVTKQNVSSILLTAVDTLLQGKTFFSYDNG